MFFSLSTKVAMLTKQVALQREKIRKMEAILKTRRNDGECINQNNETATPSIEPIAQELANLRHKNLAVEREKFKAEQHLRVSNVSFLFFNNNNVSPNGP